jgi:hypothetical protein
VLRAETASRIDSLDHRLTGRIDALAQDLGTRIDSVDQRLGGRIDALALDLGGRIDSQGSRFDSMDRRSTQCTDGSTLSTSG